MEMVSITNQGTKVAFLNINNICNSLGRDPSYLIKFLKRHFGSSFEYKNNVAYTTKKLSRDELQNGIYYFIENFVLCKRCTSPETKYFQSKKSDFIKRT
jgi:translation initiation factor 2 beta subunit (eIF-2beta)/eIF-5